MNLSSLRCPSRMDLCSLLAHRVLYALWRVLTKTLGAPFLCEGIAIAFLACAYIFSMMVVALSLGLHEASWLLGVMIGFVVLLSTPLFCAFGLGISDFVWRRFHFFMLRRLGAPLAEPWPKAYPEHAMRLGFLYREFRLRVLSRYPRRARHGAKRI